MLPVHWVCCAAMYSSSFLACENRKHFVHTVTAAKQALPSSLQTHIELTVRGIDSLCVLLPEEKNASQHENRGHANSSSVPSRL